MRPEVGRGFRAESERLRDSRSRGVRSSRGRGGSDGRCLPVRRAFAAPAAGCCGVPARLPRVRGALARGGAGGRGVVGLRVGVLLAVLEPRAAALLAVLPLHRLLLRGVGDLRACPPVLGSVRADSTTRGGWLLRLRDPPFPRGSSVPARRDGRFVHIFTLQALGLVLFMVGCVGSAGAKGGSRRERARPDSARSLLAVCSPNLTLLPDGSSLAALIGRNFAAFGVREGCQANSERVGVFCGCGRGKAPFPSPLTCFAGLAAPVHAVAPLHVPRQRPPPCAWRGERFRGVLNGLDSSSTIDSRTSTSLGCARRGFR